MLAFNEATGMLEADPITHVWVNHDPAIEQLTLSGETLDTTPEHPFFTSERGWVAAGELLVGEHVRRLDGSWGVIEQLTIEVRPVVMYNLTVARAHTFFVGDEGWLVHNLCGPFHSGKPPHVAEVSVTRKGEEVFRGTFSSGNMTAEEAALGFPQSSLATHTEARAVRQVPLQPGDSMVIKGQYPPCPSCKGAMNRAARNSGANITYTWDDKIWVAGRRRGK